MALYVDIEKKCGDFLLKVKFTAEKEVLGLLGASGCGKSMTLKCIAGIEKPDKGVIRLDDKVFFDSEKRIHLPVQKRRVGYLFQDYALFPNMTVLQNILCGAGDRKKASEYVKRFFLEGKEQLYPAQLSGGQKQRTAMARMLAGEPEILMLDEPFTALDNYLKMQLERELMKVMEDYGKTVLFVSHDRNETYRMTDRIAVMEDGQILDVQPKEELFQNPASLAATLLTGCKNVSMLQHESDGGYAATDWGIRLAAPSKEGNYKYAAFRAHYFQVVPAMEETNVVECHILRVIEDTFSTEVLFCNGNRTGEHASEVLTYELPKEEWQKLKNIETLYLKMPPEQIIWLEKKKEYIMQDGLGREIDYLRISVTDKCNLRCRYCMPPQGITPLAREEILTLEEIFRLVGIMEQLGIRKVRLTGGEPMVRKNLPWLVEQIHGLCGIREIAMTTNGTLFAPQAKVYREAGLTAVNISLDTLDPERFRCITGCDRADYAAGVDSVLRAIDAALEQQLRVKINCVPCVEMNGDDIEGIAMLAEDRPVDVRFIELMPIGCGKDYTGISSKEILRRLEQRFGKAIAIPGKVNMAIGRLTENFARDASTPADNSASRTDGPAEYYQFPGFSGRIGFISPISHKFCRECNRVRLTCEGRLKLCLHYDKGLELKPLLRGEASDEEIRERILAAVREKPSEHHFREKAADGDLADGVEEQRKMVQIGG